MSFFWPEISCIWTEYKDVIRKSPYSVRIRENNKMEQTNSVFGHFSQSVLKNLKVVLLQIFLSFLREKLIQ